MGSKPSLFLAHVCIDAAIVSRAAGRAWHAHSRQRFSEGAAPKQRLLLSPTEPAPCSKS
jgi:hypothetical protein